MSSLSPTTDREAFLAERQTGIGGSDIAALFNEGYGCERRLWYQKTGFPEDFPREQSDIMELGTFLEPLVAEKYERETGRKVETVGLKRHEIHGMLIVHIDRLITSSHRPDPGVLEIKAVGSQNFYGIKRGKGLPVDYLLQLQHGMLCTGTKWGGFAVMNRDNGKLLQWDHDANAGMQAHILAAGPAFWAKVENGPAPDRLHPDDDRCQRCAYRNSCQGETLLALAAGGSGKKEFDVSLGPLIKEYAGLYAVAKEAKELVDNAKAKIADAMGDRTWACAPGAKSIHYLPFTKKEYTVKEHVERPLRIYLEGEPTAAQRF